MTGDKIRDFFEKKTSEHPSENWDKKKDHWVTAVNDFYEDVKRILDSSINEGAVSVSYDINTISEEYIGAYEIRKMKLQIGNQIVELSPKGCNIIGASGRIDLIGELGQKTIVLQPDARWAIVATRTPTLKVVPFGESSLLEALEEIML